MTNRNFSPLTKLGAIATILADGGSERLLRSMLDAHVLRSTLADALHAGETLANGDEKRAQQILERLQTVLTERERN